MQQTNSGTNGTTGTKPTPAAERLAGLVSKCDGCGPSLTRGSIRRNPAASENELATDIYAAEDVCDPRSAPPVGGVKHDTPTNTSPLGNADRSETERDGADSIEEPERFDEATGPMDAPTGTGAVARGTDAPAVLVELARLCLVRHEQYRHIPKWMSEPEPDATDEEWTAYAKWKREDKQHEEERLGTLGQIRDFINANRAAVEAAIGGAQ